MRHPSPARRHLILALLLAPLAGAGCGGSSGECPVGQQLCAGACVNTTRDPLHCGACGMACGAGTTCVDGACKITCPPALTECSGSCRDLLSDPGHCGTCGKACEAGQVCANGTCAVSCAMGLANCGGTCRDTMADGANCGGCGKACPMGQVCSKGACGVSCAMGLTNCGGSCRDVTSDPGNCGGCAMACKQGESCSMGTCAVACQPGLTDCGGRCRDVMTDNANCGACGMVCPMGSICSMGMCALSCQASLTDCSGTCRDLQTDPAHCGKCGTACGANQVCTMGACAASCGMGLTACGNSCVNLQTDLANCGKCATPCANGTVCVAGRCAGACNMPLLTCSNVCVDPRVDPANCGACGMSCGMPANGTAACVSSACRVLCNASFADCDAQVNNGCESDLRVDASNCGHCGLKCGSPANGVGSCAAGACKVACNANFNDCDMLFGNGCESDARTDNNNCGACAKVCGPGTACVAGACVAAPPVSCRALKGNNPNAASGPYMIDPDGVGPLTPFTTFCDMTTDGGGWTLLVNRLTMSDITGQPDLNTTVGAFDANRAANFTINVTPFYAAAAEFVFAVRHNNNCANCTVSQYDAAIKVPRSASNTFSIACPSTEAVPAVKLVGPSAGQIITGYRCTGSLGWGACPNVCHWGVHGQNTNSDGSWSQNSAQEMHFPSAYSQYRSYVNNGGYCRSCGGALAPGSFNPLSSTCCNSSGNPDSSTWTVWVR